MKPLSNLFSPIKIGALELKNRIVMSPMGNDLGNPDGTVSQKAIDYFEARARGGAGLIMLGSTSVDNLSPYKHPRALWDDRFIPSFRKLTKAVHAHGAKMMPLLSHAGGITELDSIFLPSSLSLKDIRRVIEQFSDAARRAREAGFDGVELPAGGGFLVVGAFGSALRNRRTDAYGGSIENRFRLLREIIGSIRDKEGRDFPIIIRMPAEDMGQSLRETQYIAPMLAEAGIDAFDITPGVQSDSYLHSHTAAAMRGISGPAVASAKAVKEVVAVPVGLGGKINNPLFAEDILKRNEADLIIMGRALLADPELPNKAAEGRLEDIAPCIGCGLCQVEPGILKCLVNPALAREREMAITPAAKPKKVLVAGGGPGGLKAAGIAASRGHQVTLYEKGAELGGQLKMAATVPEKHEIPKVIQHLRVQMEKAGVKVQLNTEVTPALVEKTKPDVVIVATGGEPIVPDIPGAPGNCIFQAHDVLAGKVIIQPGKVVVIGGGLVGCEVAALIADPGDSFPGTRTAVTIVEMREEIGLDMAGVGNRPLLLQRLRENGVNILTSAKFKGFIEDGVVVVRDGKEEPIHGVGSVILAMGVRSVDKLSGQIKGKVAELYVIGDAKEPRRASEAIAEGTEVGRNI